MAATIGIATAGAMSVESRHGLAVAGDGYQLAVTDTTLTAGEPTPLSFSVVGEEGPVRQFDEEGGVRMHLIVVRRDLTGYQHLHPTLEDDGRWQTELTLPDAGVYRAYAGFERKREEDGPRQRPVRRRPVHPGNAPRTGDHCRARRLPRRARWARRSWSRDDDHLPADASRRAGRCRALPRCGRTPRRAPRGRPCLPARAPTGRAPRRDQFCRDVPNSGSVAPLPAVQGRRACPDGAADPERWEGALTDAPSGPSRRSRLSLPDLRSESRPLYFSGIYP